MANDTNTLEWLKRLDREDAEKKLIGAMYCVDRARHPNASASVSDWYFAKAQEDFEQALKHLERLTDLNLNGRSSIRIY